MAPSISRWQSIRDRILMVAAIFGAVIAISSIPLSFDFLNPISRAIADFDITDLAQSQFRDDSAFPPDTAIVIVNIGELDRAGIAGLITTITAHQPRVIGVDAFFRHEKQPHSDSLLEEAFSQAPNLVLPCELLDTNDDGTFDSLATSHSRFHRHARHVGFANVIASTERSFRTVRYFSPREEVGATVVPNFAVAIAHLFDSLRTASYLSADNSVEEIAYLGNTDKFYVLDWTQLMSDSTTARLVRDKIVLLGYLGTQFTGTVTTLEDAFFTPLNDHYVGRSFPDMYGVVVHANIISQILQQRRISSVAEPVIAGIAALLCWWNVGRLSTWHRRLPMLYDGLALVLVIVESLLVLFLTVYLYHRFTVRVPTTVLLMSIALAPTVHELYTQSLLPLLQAIARRILGLFGRTPVAGIVLMLGLPVLTAAQEATILNMRGTIRVIRNGTQLPATVGMRLSLSDQLQLSSGSAATLVTSDGRSVRWTKAGTVSIQNAVTKARSSPIAARFAQYVFKEATSSNSDDENYRRTMKITGAVERAVAQRRGNLDALDEVLQTTGIGVTTAAAEPSLRNYLDAALSEQTIIVAFPHTTYNLGDTLRIWWFRTKPNATYRISFRRSDGSIAAENTVQDTAVTIVRSQLGLARGVPYYWRIEEQNSSVRSAEYCVAWLTDEEERRVLDDLQQIQNDFTDDAALAEQLKARYLEDAGLHAMAALSYTRSAQLCNCSEYRRTLVEFLRRYSYLP